MSEQINFLNKLIKRIIIVHLIKNIFALGKGCERGEIAGGASAGRGARDCGRLAARRPARGEVIAPPGCGETGEVRRRPCGAAHSTVGWLVVF